MKALNGILALCFTCSILCSCVSTKKYDTAINERDTWKRNYESMEAVNKELKASTSEALKKKQQELNGKEWMLADKDAKVKQLREVMDEQRKAIHSLKQEVCNALKCFSPDELQIDVKDGKLYVSLSDKLLFPSGSDKVNERGKEAIQMLSSILAHGDLDIMVEGHTDVVPISTAKYQDNWDLSVHRATNVIRIMTNHGITPERVIASGRGEFHPLASNATPGGRQENRRTEIVLAPKLDKLWKLTENDEYPVSQR